MRATAHHRRYFFMLKTDILNKTKKLKIRGLLEYIAVVVAIILIAMPLTLALKMPMREIMSYLLFLMVPALYLLAKHQSKRESSEIKAVLEQSEELKKGLKSQDLTMEDTIGKKLG